MKAKVTQENQTLDKIVYEHYGNLDHLDDVVQENQHLMHKVILDLGDEVILNEYENKSAISNVATLWD